MGSDFKIPIQTVPRETSLSHHKITDEQIDPETEVWNRLTNLEGKARVDGKKSNNLYVNMYNPGTQVIVW